MARRATGLLSLLFGLAGTLTGQLRMVTVPVSGPSGLDSLARLGFEVADVRRTPGGFDAFIVVSPETERLLATQGFAAAAVPGAPRAGAAGDSFVVFRSFDKPLTGIRATLAAWAASDTLIHVDSVGASIEGRPILAVKIGDPNDDPARPNVLFMGTHHAREWVATEVAMQLIRWLVDSLPAALLAARDIWVIPVENPDGYQYTFTTDRLWRKNRRPNGDGTFGVDPNRNYPAFWGYDDLGSSGLPLSETYRGTAPGSEPETQAIMAFHAAHPPVFSISYHTFSGLLLYPYGFRAGALPPDLPVFRALTGTEREPAVRDSVPGSLQDRYHPGPGWILYTTNGEYTDWAYRTYGSFAITPELTSGCCTPDSGLYYGFAFPDDSVLLRRVFRDNLPFALALITAAASPATATGPTGAVPTPARVEAIWPETWVSLPTAGPMPFTLTIRTATGSTTTRSLSADSLSRGVVRTLWRSDVSVDRARAVRADGSGLEAELVSVAGAEDADLGWTGWTRTNDALVGTWSWATNTTDTLTSPVINLSGRSHLWLHFWTKYRGSTFSPQQHGVVQGSADSGMTWTDVLDLVGDGPAWYPIRVDLPQLAGSRAARIRFVSLAYSWWIDAVGIASDSTLALDSIAPPGALEVSENPVRSAPVWVSWPAGTGAPRLGIYSFTGARLLEAALAPGTTEYAWDLTAGGRTVTNGAYLVVLELDGRVLRRRLFITR